MMLSAMALIHESYFWSILSLIASKDIVEYSLNESSRRNLVKTFLEVS